VLCKEVPLYGSRVCLIAVNRPLIGDGNPLRLPILAVKTSTGKVVEHGIEYYLTREWKERWNDWIANAVTGFPSVLEHVTFTLFFDGVSRVFSHQLVRHRIASFTQESQRYTEIRLIKAIKESPFWKEHNDCDEVCNAFYAYMSALNALSYGPEKRNDAIEVVRKIFAFPEYTAEIAGHVISTVIEYFYMRRNGKKMEEARFVLPNGMRTSILMTVNLREWLHIVELRTSPKAQEEMRLTIKTADKVVREKIFD